MKKRIITLVLALFLMLSLIPWTPIQARAESMTITGKVLTGDSFGEREFDIPNTSDVYNGLAYFVEDDYYTPFFDGTSDLIYKADYSKCEFAYEDLNQDGRKELVISLMNYAGWYTNFLFVEEANGFVTFLGAVFSYDTLRYSPENNRLLYIYTTSHTGASFRLTSSGMADARFEEGEEGIITYDWSAGTDYRYLNLMSKEEILPLLTAGSGSAAQQESLRPDVIDSLNGLLCGVHFGSEYTEKEVDQWSDETLSSAIYSKLLWYYHGSSEKYLVKMGLDTSTYSSYDRSLINQLTQHAFGRDFPQSPNPDQFSREGDRLVIHPASGESTQLAVQSYVQNGNTLTAVGVAVQNYTPYREFLGYFRAVCKKNPASIYGYTLVSIEQIYPGDPAYSLTAHASSELTEGSLTHKAEWVLDGKHRTSWVEGVSGVGENEYVQISTTDGSLMELCAIDFLPGYHQNDNLLTANGWPTKIRIECEGGFSQESYFHMTFLNQYDVILLDQPVKTSWIRITILEAEAGTKYTDTCITEIHPLGIDSAAYLPAQETPPAEPVPEPTIEETAPPAEETDPGVPGVEARFSSDVFGWSFVNSAAVFASNPQKASGYHISKERYEEVFGSAFVDATNIYSKTWGGNCAGMTTTAILFSQGLLNWSAIASQLPYDYPTPNSFALEYNYSSTADASFCSIGNDTEVSRLIEAYQLYINAVRRGNLTQALNDTYVSTELQEDQTHSSTDRVYPHIPADEGGTYIATMLETFQQAYTRNLPLYISLKGNQFGHAIVSRTDKQPADMGDGWWRVYVYDPNKPYVNDAIVQKLKDQYPDAALWSASNGLTEDVYMELNPGLNLWRYSTSVNSSHASSYLGSNLNNEVVYIEQTVSLDGTDYIYRRPEYFYVLDVTDLTLDDYADPHFNSTSAWIPEEGCAIISDGGSSFVVYNSESQPVASVKNGSVTILGEEGYVHGYIGATLDDTSSSCWVFLPEEGYSIQYSSGSITITGNDNALSFSADTQTALTFDLAGNAIDIQAAGEGDIYLKCANISSTDSCSFVETEGALRSGESLHVSYPEENQLLASTDSKNGSFEFTERGSDRKRETIATAAKASAIPWLLIGLGGAILFFITVLVVILVLLIKAKSRKSSQ